VFFVSVADTGLTRGKLVSVADAGLKEDVFSICCGQSTSVETKEVRVELQRTELGSVQAEWEK
jgi:hypothetical protein